MSMKSAPYTPKYRRHKASNRAYVELNGRRTYLGPFGSPESQAEYHRLLAEWMANGCQSSVDPQEIATVEPIARYLDHVESYYVRPDGSATSEQGQIRRALTPVKDLYGRERAVTFGPKALRTIRQVWLDRGLCRTSINTYVSEVKRMFRWAVSHELVPPATY